MTPPWAVMSPIRAAGIPPINTVNEPIAITSGGPTQVAISLTRAAGILPINTVGQHGGNIGPPTCGTTPVTIGQVCISPTLAAGGMDLYLLSGCGRSRGRVRGRRSELWINTFYLGFYLFTFTVNDT